MKNALLVIILIFFGASAQAQSQWFGELYTEGNYFGRDHNGVGFGRLRVGEQMGDTELYGTLRGSSDTRSNSSPLGQIYNDNFVFLGVGADYLPAIAKGFRLRAEVGNSFNLLDRTHLRAGIDFEAGLLTYHEGNLGLPNFSFENYGEGLYIHRYQNFLVDEQFRVLYRRFEIQKATFLWGACPIVMAVLNYDTGRVFYNRFFDFRMGVRFQARASTYVFSLTPEWVSGAYLSERHDAYGEFRILAVAYVYLF